MPEHRIHIPPEHEAFFQEVMEAVGGTVFSTDVTTPLDFPHEIPDTYNLFVSRLNRLNSIHDEISVEALRAMGYRRLLAELANVTYRPDQLIRIDYKDIILPFRSALVDHFIAQLNPEPKKILQGNVPAAIGIPPIESIILYYGLDDGEPLIEGDIEKRIGYPASMVRNSRKSFVSSLILQGKQPRKLRSESHPLHQHVFATRRILTEESEAD